MWLTNPPPTLEEVWSLQIIDLIQILLVVLKAAPRGKPDVIQFPGGQTSPHLQEFDNPQEHRFQTLWAAGIFYNTFQCGAEAAELLLSSPHVFCHQWMVKKTKTHRERLAQIRGFFSRSLSLHRLSGCHRSKLSS